MLKVRSASSVMLRGRERESQLASSALTASIFSFMRRWDFEATPVFDFYGSFLSCRSDFASVCKRLHSLKRAATDRPCALIKKLLLLASFF